MTCLDDNLVSRFLVGGISGDEQVHVESELAHCASCRRLVAELSRVLCSGGDSLLRADELASADPAPKGEMLGRGRALDRYVIEDVLGAGAMGIVYAAHDPELDRPLAIKTIRLTAGSDPQRRDRLRQEARLMARLEHPNVCTVHDVVENGDQLFLVLERIDGVTLREWMERDRPPWRAVLAVFIDAGRGLAAAHAAGILHRDVKPDNLLRANNGRVVVTDFGLARFGDGDPGEPPGSPSPAGTPPMTASGDLAGSPAYMAPERILDGATTAASDQFSFFVSLFECLYGGRPFAGSTAAAIADNASAGRFAGSPSTRVPARVRRVVLRGLAADPTKRYPDLTAAVRALEQVAARGPRRLLAMVAALGLVAAIAGYAAGRGRVDTADCPSPRLTIGEVWNPASRAGLSARLAGRADRYQAAVRERLDAAFAAYAERWNVAAASCSEAAPAPPRGYAGCLARAAARARALLTLISESEVNIDRAPIAVHALPDPTACLDPRSPDLIAGAIDDPAAVDQLARAAAELDLGAYAHAAELAVAVAAGPAAATRPGLRAEALLVAARAGLSAGDLTAAEQHLLAASDAAARARDDELAARALIALVRVTAQARPRQAAQTLAFAEAAVARAGRSPHLEAALRIERAFLAGRDDRHADAVEDLRRAVALREAAALGPEDLSLARPLSDLARQLAGLGKFAEAYEVDQRALRVIQRHLPDSHPQVTLIQNNLAIMALELGRYEEAEAGFRRVLTEREARHGAEHPEVADALDGLAEALRLRGKLDDGLGTARRALEIRRRALPADDVDQALSVNNVASFLIDLGRCDEALPDLDRAVTGLAADNRPLEWLARTVGNQVHCRCLTGQVAAGRAAAEAALAKVRATYPPDHPAAAELVAEIAMCELADRRPAAAEALLRRVIDMRVRMKVAPLLLAETRWWLALVIDELGRRREARELAEQTRTVFAAAGRPEADEISRWLHDPRSIPKRR